MKELSEDNLQQSKLDGGESMPPAILKKEAKVSNKKKADGFTYRIHADGHVVVVSGRSKSTGRTHSIRATSSNIHRIVYTMDQPLEIDAANLSNVQLEGILSAISEMGASVKVLRTGTNTLVAKKDTLRGERK